MNPGDPVQIRSMTGTDTLIGLFDHFDGQWAKVIVSDEDYPEGKVVTVYRKFVIPVMPIAEA